MEQSENYLRIEGAIEYLENNFQRQPNLDEIAASVHLSKFHFQRLFKQWAGVTPSQFLHYLTIDYAKQRLRESQSILSTTLDSGLSSPSRLHDLFITFEAMTPGEYKRGGSGLVISHGIHPTPFGDCLVAVTTRGICALRFITAENKNEIMEKLKMEWPHAHFTESTTSTRPVIEKLFAAPLEEKKKSFHLMLKGTNFQVQVWQALLAIPPGSMVTYQDVANHIGNPKGTRAVASAVSRNPIGYIIPCHRVISKTGKSHHYRWGSSRKKAILGWEASLAQS